MNGKKWFNRFMEAHERQPWALITGGSSGMGLEYARQLAEIGCSLLLVSNQREALKIAAESLKQGRDLQVVPRYQDLSTETAAEELFAFCQTENLQIDILINNAGMFFFEELSSENEAKAMTMMRLHTFVPTRLCILFGEAMKQRGYGYLLNMPLTPCSKNMFVLISRLLDGVRRLQKKISMSYTLPISAFFMNLSKST